MDLQNLYHEIKMCIELFGLNWNEKHKIEVNIHSKDFLSLTYKDNHGNISKKYILIK